MNCEAKPNLRQLARRPLIQALSSWALWIACTAAATAEFSAKPYIQGGALYDTNPYFQTSGQNPEAAWGTIFDVRLPLKLQTPRASISLAPRLLYSFYPDEKFEGAELRDKYLTGGANWNSRQSNLGASYGYTNLSLRTSEFDSSGGSGTTRFSRDDTQRRWYFQPYWQYQLSPVNAFNLNGGYDEVRYDEKFVRRRFNYDYTFASAGLTHTFNPRHSISLRARFAKFDAENMNLRITNDSETNSLSLIYNYAWSDTTQLLADLGWARTKNTVIRPNNIDPITGPYCEPAFIAFLPCEFKSDSANFVGNLSATKRSETTNYTIAIGQSVTPNSNGAEVLRFRINASASKTFSERINGLLSIAAFTQDDVGSSTRDFEQDGINARLRLNYRLAQHWSLYGAYVYTFRKTTQALFEDRTIRNHALSFGVTYQGDGWRW